MLYMSCVRFIWIRLKSCPVLLPFSFVPENMYYMKSRLCDIYFLNLSEKLLLSFTTSAPAQSPLPPPSSLLPPFVTSSVVSIRALAAVVGRSATATAATDDSVHQHQPNTNIPIKLLLLLWFWLLYYVRLQLLHHIDNIRSFPLSWSLSPIPSHA